MSGSNSNMTLVTNVAEDLDGTDPSLSPYTWTCPEVDPYSTIYFYQFNAAADKSNPAWTTRFTVGKSTDRSEIIITLGLTAQIASSAGETDAPPHSQQPNGDEIPWGIGVMRSGSPMTSREKKISAEENDSDEDYGNDGDEKTSQGPSHGEVSGGTDDDDSEDGTSPRKGGSASSRTSNGDSDGFEVSEDDGTATSPKSKSSKSSLKNTEDDSKDSDATDSRDGIDGSPASVEGEDEELESTSSRMKTVRTKPTSTPHNVNAVTPALSLPSATSLSAQPVGCAGGINATSSYCSAPTSANRATRISKLGSRTLLATVLLCLIPLL